MWCVELNDLELRISKIYFECKIKLIDLELRFSKINNYIIV